MKILSAEQTRQADRYTIEHGKISSLDLMERAGTECANWLLDKYPMETLLAVICGQGNNGGDGLVVARKWKAEGRNVAVFVVKTAGRGTEAFDYNLGAARDLGIEAKFVDDGRPLSGLHAFDVVVDALFGSGLNRAVEDMAAMAIEEMNRSGAETVSIDMPSGLFADQPPVAGSAIVKADHTLTFQYPKLALLLPQTGSFAGEFHVLPIGLHQGFLEEAESSCFYLLSVAECASLFKREKFVHKGNFGHVLMIAGSYGKMGAAVLAMRAALRSGAGLVTAFVPACGHQVMQSSVPEAMVLAGAGQDMVSAVPDVKGFDVIAMGPGIGTDGKTAGVLKGLLQSNREPMVFDADALNLLATHSELMGLLPENSILTPHPGEFKRLFGDSKNDFERLETLRNRAMDLKVFILLKGAHSALATPDGQVYFNSKGNSGMATGGTGDVLTGTIAALLAQSQKPFESALVGMFVHGLAGDLTAEDFGKIGMIAGDLIDHLPFALRKAFERED